VLKTNSALNVNMHLVGMLKKCLNYLYLYMYTGKRKVILDCSNFRTDFWGFVNPNAKFIIIFRSFHIRDISTRRYTSSFTDFYKWVCKFAPNLSLQDFIPRHETLYNLQMLAKTCSKGSSNVSHSVPSVSLSRSHKAVTVHRPA
jgi:hypothetical protein